jgi:hypothetical protein
MEDLFALLVNLEGFECSWRNGQLYVRHAETPIAPLARELAPMRLQAAGAARTTSAEPKEASSRTCRLTSETAPSVV